MDTVQEHIDRYIKQREKDPKQVIAVRVVKSPTEFGHLVWLVEIDVYNGFVTYTEVFHMKIVGGVMKYNTITMKTRLQVPIDEVPLGADVYLDDGHGPYTLFTFDVPPKERTALFILRDDEGATRYLTPGTYVSVAFYYVRGEGAVAGGRMLAGQDKIMEWIEQADLFGGLPRLVGGCKFEMWAAACAAIGCKSVFDLPKD